MIVYCVNVYVTPGNEAAFLEASRENHLATRREPGNLRFDVLQHQQEPGRFLLYEVYTSQDAVTAHKQTDHYLKWKETVAPWMARPREGLCFEPRFPGDEGQW